MYSCMLRLQTIRSLSISRYDNWEDGHIYRFVYNQHHPVPVSRTQSIGANVVIFKHIMLTLSIFCATIFRNRFNGGECFLKGESHGLQQSITLSSLNCSSKKWNDGLSSDLEHERLMHRCQLRNTAQLTFWVRYGAVN